MVGDTDFDILVELIIIKLCNCNYTLSLLPVATRRLRQLQPILQRCTQRPFFPQPAQSELIQVTPKVSLFTDKVHIKVQGLPSKAKVTLHAMTEHEWRRKPAQFVSCSHYVASHSGEVDLQKDASVGGTYTGEELR